MRRKQSGGRRPLPEKPGMTAAYMTVEASLLIPMVLCVLVIGIYVAFYMYDRCTSYQDAYILCLRESYRKDEDAPSVDTEEMEEAAEELPGSRYIAVDAWEGSPSADGKWAVYEGSARVSPPVFGGYFLMPDDIWTISFQAKSRKTDPSWSIRSWRRKSQVIRYGLDYVTSWLSGSDSSDSTE